MSTFRQDPEDRDSARGASDIRALRQRISTGLLKRRPMTQVESLDRASRPAAERHDNPSTRIEDVLALLDDRELVSR